MDNNKKISRKPTELNSVKMPCWDSEFIQIYPVENTISILLQGEITMQSPSFKIPINGELAKHIVDDQRCAWNRLEERWRFRRLLQKPPIDLRKVIDDVTAGALENNLNGKIKFKIMSVEFLINKKRYKMVYQSSSKALVLTSIDGMGIGKQTEAWVNSLLLGDLSFCMPSKCWLTWRQEKVCEI